MISKYIDTTIGFKEYIQLGYQYVLEYKLINKSKASSKTSKKTNNKASLALVRSIASTKTLA